VNGDDAGDRLARDQRRQGLRFRFGQGCRTREIAWLMLPGEVLRRKVPVEVHLARGVLLAPNQPIRIQRRNQPERTGRDQVASDQPQGQIRHGFDGGRFVAVHTGHHQQRGRGRRRPCRRRIAGAAKPTGADGSTFR